MTRITPGETALFADTLATTDDMSPKRVVETGSPCVKERLKAACSMGSSLMGRFRRLGTVKKFSVSMNRHDIF